MLLIFLPVPLVSGAVGMSILAISIGFIVFPLTVVDITISMDQPSSSVCFIALPVSLVDAAIRPNLSSPSVSKCGIDLPLAIVLSSVSHVDLWLLHLLYAIPVIFIRDEPKFKRR